MPYTYMYTTYTTATGVCADLENPANTYDLFMFKLFKYDFGIGDWVYETANLEYGYFQGSEYYCDTTFIDLEPGAWYVIGSWARYDGVWYPSDPAGAGAGWWSSFAQCPSIEPALITFISSTSDSLTFSRVRVASEGDLLTYIWMYDDGWMTIQSSGFSYSVDGDNLTLYGLTSDFPYYFFVETIIGSYYSRAPDYAPYYVTYYTEANDRPELFNWDYTRTIGMNYDANKITADEWIRLQDNINAVAEYKGMSTYGFIQPSPGSDFLSYYWNEVRNAINDIYPYYPIPNTKSSGDSLIASEFEDLKTCINSVV